MRIIILACIILGLTGCASLSAGLGAMGNGLSQKQTVTCNTSYYGSYSTSNCQ